MKNQTFTINGKTYNSFDELPEEIKQKLDKDGNGVPDLIEKFKDSPLSALFDANNKPDLEAVKSYFNQNTDPAKISNIGAFIRGILVVLLLIGLGIYLSKYF